MSKISFDDITYDHFKLAGPHGRRVDFDRCIGGDCNPIDSWVVYIFIPPPKGKFGGARKYGEAKSHKEAIQMAKEAWQYIHELPLREEKP